MHVFIKPPTMKKHIPNAITCCNLICGCIATCYAFHHHFTLAFIFILAGAFFDFFDGMSARALGVSGKMGVELDSLADMVTFGVAPSAMIFTLFSYVPYPSFLANWFGFNILPFSSFLIAAFSGLRLAKFNIDERQHMGFIGMPTPANAIFWASLISSSEAWLTSRECNTAFLTAFIVMFSFLLVCEIPMFALKFKNLTWADNKIKFIFILIVLLILTISAIFGITDGNLWQTLSRGVSLIILTYLAMGIVAYLLPKQGDR